MAKSTFGSSFAQSFQQSVAAARRAAEEEAAEKRYDKRVAEQRAYGAMQESKKELYRLGGTEEEAATYNGEDNLYAIGLRIAELRDQYNAGRTGQLSGEGSGQPVDSLLGKIGIDTSLGYQKGVQVAKSEQLEQKFKDQLARDNASAIRGDLRKDAEQTRLDRAVAFGASRPELPFDFNQPIDKIELDQKAVEAMEAHNIARMQAGLEPMPLSERYTSGMQPEGTGTARRPMEPTFTKPTQGSYSQVFNAEQLRNFGTLSGQAAASAGGRIAGENNQAANRALSDKDLPEEYRALFDQPDFKSKYGALMNQYYQNQALGEAGKIRNKTDLDAFLQKQASIDSYEIIKGAEALGIVAGVDGKTGLVTEDFKKKFLSEFEKKKTVSRSRDPDTGEDTSTTVTNWVRRGTNKPRDEVNKSQWTPMGSGEFRPK